MLPRLDHSSWTTTAKKRWSAQCQAFRAKLASRASSGRRWCAQQAFWPCKSAPGAVSRRGCARPQRRRLRAEFLGHRMLKPLPRRGNERGARCATVGGPLPARLARGRRWPAMRPARCVRRPLQARALGRVIFRASARYFCGRREFDFTLYNRAMMEHWSSQCGAFWACSQ